jgi:hypothetical protein
MANNLFLNRANAVVCKAGVPAASIFTSGNLHIAYRIDNAMASYVPDRLINGFTTFEVGKGYYIIPKVDLDYTAYFVAPLQASFTREKIAEFVVGPGSDMIDDQASYVNALLIGADGVEVLADGIQLPEIVIANRRSISFVSGTGTINFAGNVNLDEIITIYKLTTL